MKHEINVWIEDIRKSIKKIHAFLPETLSYLNFEKDLKTRKAVERNIEIIGETLNSTRLDSPVIFIMLRSLHLGKV